MTGRTHRWIGAASSGCLCAALSAAPAVCVVTIGTALAVSRLPDSIEKPLHARHRTYTHWPLLGLTLAILAGVVTSLLPSLAGDVADAHAVPGRTLAMLPGPVTVGFFIGYVGHIAADACTVSGVPLAGPFSLRDVWLLPRRLRIRVYVVVVNRAGRAVSEPSVGDRAWRMAAMAVTALAVYLSLRV